MSMSIFVIPDDCEPVSVIARLADVLADMLVLADHVGLPQPRYCTVSDAGSIALQFRPERASIDAIRSWASAYCAAVRSDPRDGADGPEVWVSAEFEDDGVKVCAYAHVPVPARGPVAS